MYVGQVKRKVRTGWQLCNVEKPESVADHMYRMALMTFLLPQTVNFSSLPGQESQNVLVNREKVMKIVVVHDLAESITGDITPYCGISREEKLKRETDAMHEICSHLETDISQEIMNLWNEYNHQSSAEARVAKDFDKLDMVLQAYEYEKEENNIGRLQNFFDHVQGQYASDVARNLAIQLDELRSNDQQQQDDTQSA